MLISFGVENFRSFGERQEFTFLAGNDKTHADRLFSAGKLRVSRISALYGPNASGKSNLWRALRFVTEFVRTSATRMNQGDPIEGVAPFRLDERLIGQPSRFDVSILIGETRYEYAFACTGSLVVEESLSRCKAGGRASLVFSRKRDDATGETEWVFRGFGKRDEELLKSKTRDNGLILSRGAELNVEEFVSLYEWFGENIVLVNNADQYDIRFSQTAEFIRSSGAFRNRVLRFLKDADFGISDVNVIEGQWDWGSLPEGFVNEFVKLLPKSDGGPAQPLNVNTTHLSISGKPVDFDLNVDESNGTQRWFGLAGIVLDALDEGMLVVVDELDRSLHPILTERLVRLFGDPTANPKGAQLLFTTHDTSLMRQDLFRRDQIWLAQKRPSGETELFSLFDFPRDSKPRKQEPLAKRYLSGMYGAVPNLGPTFEHLELP
jgi:hypothetical protein